MHLYVCVCVCINDTEKKTDPVPLVTRGRAIRSCLGMIGNTWPCTGSFLKRFTGITDVCLRRRGADAPLLTWLIPPARLTYEQARVRNQKRVGARRDRQNHLLEGWKKKKAQFSWLLHPDMFSRHCFRVRSVARVFPWRLRCVFCFDLFACSLRRVVKSNRYILWLTKMNSFLSMKAKHLVWKNHTSSSLIPGHVV